MNDIKEVNIFIDDKDIILKINVRWRAVIMNEIISVIVPGYNTEKYLEKC